MEKHRSAPGSRYSHALPTCPHGYLCHIVVGLVSGHESRTSCTYGTQCPQGLSSTTKTGSCYMNPQPLASFAGRIRKCVLHSLPHFFSVIRLQFLTGHLLDNASCTDLHPVLVSPTCPQVLSQDLFQGKPKPRHPPNF